MSLLSDLQLVTRVRRRLRNRFDGALSFLVATAWVHVFEDLFYRISGNGDSFGFLLLRAVLLTVVAAVVTALLETFVGEETDDEHLD